MLRRLDEYHLNNTEDNTMLNYFNEKEIHPVVLNIMNMPETRIVFTNIIPYLGPTSEFEPTEEEEMECHRLEVQRKKLLEEEAEIKKQVSYSKINL